MADAREGLLPWQSSGNDAYDKMTQQGAYWPYGAGNYGPFATMNDWPATPVNAKPLLPVAKTSKGDLTYVKQAPRDTIVFDDAEVNAAKLLDLFFEDMGGLELANVSRADLIDGQQVSYSPIKNLSNIKRKFAPNNIIASFESTNTAFSKFAIDLIRRGIYLPYVDSETGNVIIEIDNVDIDEEVEVYILSNGTIEEVFDE